jgi:hypothetical protein
MGCRLCWTGRLSHLRGPNCDGIPCLVIRRECKPAAVHTAALVTFVADRASAKQLTEHGAAAAVWRRLGRAVEQTLTRSTSPDGENLYRDQLPVRRGRVRQLHGQATTSGNDGPISMPRLDRSTTRPASTETRARDPPHFGSAAQPGRSLGTDLEILRRICLTSR